jgi:hypothetical protein
MISGFLIAPILTMDSGQRSLISAAQGTHLSRLTKEPARPLKNYGEVEIATPAWGTVPSPRSPQTLA